MTITSTSSTWLACPIPILPSLLSMSPSRQPPSGDDAFRSLPNGRFFLFRRQNHVLFSFSSSFAFTFSLPTSVENFHDALLFPLKYCINTAE